MRQKVASETKSQTLSSMKQLSSDLNEIFGDKKKQRWYVSQENFFRELD